MHPAFVLAGAAAAIKGVQAMFDKDFPGTEFPKKFRAELIQEHWNLWGGYCSECERSSLRKRDLTVDHIVPIRKGGRNSRANAQVICGSCNSRKGDRCSLLDRFAGRGGRRPRRRRR